VAPRLDSRHGVVARLQANKLSAIRLELETTRAGKPLRSAQGVSSPENKPLAQYSRHYVRPDVRPSEHKLYGANSRNWRKSLILLARPKRFELLTPRFVGWSHPLSRHKLLQTGRYWHPKVSKG
jgi:hypothetical protein